MKRKPGIVAIFEIELNSIWQKNKTKTATISLQQHTSIFVGDAVMNVAARKHYQWRVPPMKLSASKANQ